jgi:hypothetical protein
MDMTAMALYDMMYQELALNPRYKRRMTRKRRCIRLDFEGHFHLDVLPARSARTGTRDGRIEVPDRELKGWVSSNPKGYALWFEQQAEAARALYMASERLPNDYPTHAQKPTLNRAVQLWKRRRDVVFSGRDEAPRSIILTTLAAHYYDGQADVATSLLGILHATAQAIERAAPHRIHVLNPTNPAEDFGDRWDNHSYRAFTGFVDRCIADVGDIKETQGLPKLFDLLRRLFGVDVADVALQRYRRAMADEGNGSSSGLWVMPGVGLTTRRSPGSIQVPRSTHYGG